ncbi:MAG: hypothetical protein CL920_35795 [Deltaproteobacteria bacterium]|nr:hypothetical protein [Deltaproteobacteria bacterium]MBU54090.1 hypothetical protein [Deltaproteobacteria bacterium]
MTHSDTSLFYEELKEDTFSHAELEEPVLFRRTCVLKKKLADEQYAECRELLNEIQGHLEDTPRFFRVLHRCLNSLEEGKFNTALLLIDAEELFGERQLGQIFALHTAKKLKESGELLSAAFLYHEYWHTQQECYQLLDELGISYEELNPLYDQKQLANLRSIRENTATDGLCLRALALALLEDVGIGDEGISEGLDILFEAVSNYPLDVEHYDMLIAYFDEMEEIAEDDKHIKRLLKHLQDVTRQHPDEWRFWLRLAHVYHAFFDEPERVEKAFSRALELAPSEREVLDGVREWLWSTEEWDQLADHLKRCLEGEPGIFWKMELLEEYIEVLDEKSSEPDASEPWKTVLEETLLTVSLREQWFRRQLHEQQDQLDIWWGLYDILAKLERWHEIAGLLSWRLRLTDQLDECKRLCAVLHNVVRSGFSDITFYPWQDLIAHMHQRLSDTSETEQHQQIFDILRDVYCQIHLQPNRQLEILYPWEGLFQVIADYHQRTNDPDVAQQFEDKLFEIYHIDLDHPVVEARRLAKRELTPHKVERAPTEQEPDQPLFDSSMLLLMGVVFLIMLVSYLLGT